jgi:hypothetical protein
MSCYNWCSGTIKLPTKEWAAFRKSLIREHNHVNDYAFNMARSIHAEIKEDSKYKRKYDYYDPVFSKVYNQYADKLTYTHQSLVMNSLIYSDNGSYKLQLPKKKNFSKANLKTVDYGYFKLKHDSKSISYDVDQNNRAVESAQQDPFVKFVFNKLNSIVWTRNSGGVIVGNDEYNQENTYEGGGANYIVYRFGTLGERTFFATCYS